MPISSHSPRYAQDIYKDIEQQFFLQYRSHLLAEEQQVDTPNAQDQTRIASESIVLAAIQIAVEQINRGKYSEQTIDAVTELISNLLGSEPKSTRDLLTHIRDTKVSNLEQKSE